MTNRSKTEIARLVRATRTRGYFATDTAGTIFMYCPVHREALRAANMERHVLPHKFVIAVLPWEKPTTVAAVTKALVSHLDDSEYDGEPCDKV